MFCAGIRVESWKPVLSPCYTSKEVRVRYDVQALISCSLCVPRCFDRVLGCPAGSGSSWEGLTGQTKLGKLFSVAFGYHDTGQSDYPRNVVKQKRIVDAPNDDDMLTFRLIHERQFGGVRL